MRTTERSAGRRLPRIRVLVALLGPALLASSVVLGQEEPTPSPLRMAEPLAELIPLTVEGRPVQSWTLEGTDYLAAFDDGNEADLRSLKTIEQFLDGLGAKEQALSLGNAIYATEAGDFASMTAVRVADAESETLLDGVLELWAQGRIVGTEVQVEIEGGDTAQVVPLLDPAAKAQVPVFAYPVGDVVWLIDAPTAELPSIIASLREETGE